MASGKGFGSSGANGGFCSFAKARKPQFASLGADVVSRAPLTGLLKAAAWLHGLFLFTENERSP